MGNKNERSRDIDREKERIRERYAGTDGVTVIPARPRLSLSEDEREKRVAVYARVSTGDPRQTSSYELQKNHYQDMVNRHPGWTLVDIYADDTCIIGTNQSPARGRRFVPTFFVFSTLEAAKG